MKKIFTVLAIGMLSAWSVDAHAQLGGLGGLAGNKSASKSAGSEDLGAKADKFVADSTLVRDAVVYSLMQIGLAVGDKKQIELIKKTQQSLKATTDPKEKGAKTGAAIKDLGSEVALQLKAADAQEKMKNLSPQMQKKVAASLLTLGIAALKTPQILEEGKGILQGLSSNPVANMSKIGPMKDGVSMLAEAATKLPPIVSAGFTMLKTMKVDAGTPTAGAKLTVDTELLVPEG